MLNAHIVGIAVVAIWTVSYTTVPDASHRHGCSVVTVKNHGRNRLYWAEPEPKRSSSVACVDKTRQDVDRGATGTGRAQQDPKLGNGTVACRVRGVRGSDNRHWICLDLLDPSAPPVWATSQ